MSTEQKEILVGLDVGTSKVIAIVAEVDDNGEVDVLGYGMEPSIGIKRGMVVNIDATQKAVRSAIKDAENDANCEIKSVNAGIAGSHIKGFDNTGSARISNKEVSADDVSRVLETAQAFRISADDRLLHIIPQDFTVDGQGGIKDPLGMTGVRLDANVHMVTCLDSAADNISKCISRSGFSVDRLILQPLASAEAVLIPDEKEIGVVLVDIGAGTTDISVFQDGFLRHTEILPIAGDHITNDIAVFTRSPTTVAEDIKLQYSCCHTDLVDATRTISVPEIGDRGNKELRMYTLAQVAEARVRELLALVAKKLHEAGFHSLGAGVVITGGTAKLKGLEMLAQEELQMPVRIGKPLSVLGPEEITIDPAYATVIGLVRYGYHDNSIGVIAKKPKKALFLGISNWFKRIF